MKASVAQALLFLSFSVMVLGQTPPAFRTTTRLVQMNVIVSDKNGPVEGLTKEDFVLYDQGKKQNIAVFEPHTRRNTTAVEPVRPVASNEFTNARAGSAPDDPNAVVIVWDLINTPFADQVLAREAVLKSLSVVRPEDRVGVYILSTQFTVIQDFTTDSSQLVATLEKYTRKPDLWGGAGEMITLGVSGHSAPDGILQMRGDRTKAAFRKIAERLAGVRGRKSVIWICAVPPAFDPWEAPFPLYIVDAKGLRSVDEILPDKDATRMPPLDSKARVMMVKRPPPVPSFSPIVEAMQMAAESTGGRAFVNSNDIRGAIDKALSDSDVTYTLGFYPRLSERDHSEYHTLKVTVKRRGVTVRCPLYYAVDPFVPSPEELVAGALTNDLDFTQLTLTARLERDGGALHVPVSVGPGHILRKADAGDRWTAQLDYVMAQRSANGDVLDMISRSVTVDQDAQQHEAFLKQGLPLTETLTKKPGLASIRIVVLDHNAGAVGALSIPVPPEGQTTPATGPQTGEVLAQKGATLAPAASAASLSLPSVPDMPPAAPTSRLGEDLPSGGTSHEDPLIRRAADATLRFAETLPNYICHQVISRSRRFARDRNWHLVDTVESDLVFEDGKEDYRDISVNGKPVDKGMQELGGARSTGEFASLLRMLFAPSTEAEFLFIKLTRIAGVDTHEYAFSVKEDRSQWTVHAGSRTFRVAYTGSVWIDPTNARVLRIEMKASGLRPNAGLDMLETSTDYEYILLSSGSPYLLPVRATFSSCVGITYGCVQNDIEFRNYRKFEAQSGIEYGDLN